MSTFCQRLYHRKCQHRGVGGQEKPKSCQVVVPKVRWEDLIIEVIFWYVFSIPLLNKTTRKLWAFDAARSSTDQIKVYAISERH